MSSENKQSLKTILHPYLFILKEGKTIKSDFLDYSLMMLLINASETIKSPATNKKNSTSIVANVEINICAKPTILGGSKTNE